MMNRTRLVAFVVVLASAAATPVYAGTMLTKPQVIQRASLICRAAQRRVEALPPIRSQHPFAKTAPKGDAARAIRFLAVYGDALESVRQGLAKLDLPPQGRSLLRGFITDLGPIIATFRRAHSDAIDGRYSTSEAAANRAFGLFAQASKKTAAYGFPKGVCQAGQ
jgi:hypothetical protein